MGNDSGDLFNAGLSRLIKRMFLIKRLNLLTSVAKVSKLLKSKESHKKKFSQKTLIVITFSKMFQETIDSCL